MNLTETEVGNETNRTWTDDGDHGKSIISVIIFVEATTSVLVVCGNFFVLALIQRKKLLGRSTNVFVFSIAVADFMNGLLSIPAHATSLLYQGASVQVYLCKGYRFIIFLTKTVVPYTILFMTAEKVMRILCPTREIVTVARCMFFTSLLWFFASAFNIWSVVLYTVDNSTTISITHQRQGKTFTESFTPHRCILNRRFDNLHLAFLTVDFIILFAIPALGIISLYMVLLFKYFSVLRERIVTYFYVIKLVMALSLNVVITHLPFEFMIFYENIISNPSWFFYCATFIVTSVHFTRGVGNMIIYGYFKHYVCRKQHMASIRATSGDSRFKLRVPSLRNRNVRNNRKTAV